MKKSRHRPEQIVPSYTKRRFYWVRAKRLRRYAVIWGYRMRPTTNGVETMAAWG